MNLVETSLRFAADNKEYLRVNLSCKWTPISLQGEHLISTIFWIPDESTLHVKVQAIENINPHNYPNRRVRQPLCDSEDLQKKWTKEKIKAWAIF